MPSFKLQRPQMDALERCVWAQATRVYPRPKLVLLSPRKHPGEEVVRAGTMAAAVALFADVLREVPSGPPCMSSIESILGAYARSDSRLLASQELTSNS